MDRVRNSGIRFREAILRALLNDRDCDDDTAIATAGGGRKVDVRWRRHGIYRIIRLREEDSTGWDVAAQALKDKVESESIDRITAVTWAVMKHFDNDNEAAMDKAGLASFRRWREDGYAPMARTIWERVATLSADEAADWLTQLERQMAQTAGKRNRGWIERLDQQIATLHSLSGRTHRTPPVLDR